MSTTLLGDWYANLIHVGRLQFILAVCERTFLPVVIPAPGSPIVTMVPRLRAQIVDSLRGLGISEVAMEGESAHMVYVAFGKTANRQVTGVMVDFAKALPFHVGDGTLLEVSLRLAETPCGPLFETTIFPSDATRAAFNEKAVRLVYSR